MQHVQRNLKIVVYFSLYKKEIRLISVFCGTQRVLHIMK